MFSSFSRSLSDKGRALQRDQINRGVNAFAAVVNAGIFAHQGARQFGIARRHDTPTVPLRIAAAHARRKPVIVGRPTKAPPIRASGCARPRHTRRATSMI